MSRIYHIITLAVLGLFSVQAQAQIQAVVNSGVPTSGIEEGGFLVASYGAVAADVTPGTYANASLIEDSLTSAHPVSVSSNRFNNATSLSYLTAKSNYTSRDMECQGNGNIMWLYARLTEDGRAIGLYVNKNVDSGEGRMQLYYVTGVQNIQGQPATQSLLGSVSGLATKFGFSNTAEQDDIWTVGVRGPELYVFWQPDAETEPVEVYRHAERAWLHMEFGHCAWASGNTGSSAYGHTIMRATHTEHNVLQTDALTAAFLNAPDNAFLIDALDVGAKALRTTGSIAAGDSVLTVADASGFEVGDHIIVEIKTDTDDPRGDTTGVGGYWPGQSVPTFEDLPDPTTLGGMTYIYVVEDSLVYRSLGGGCGICGWELRGYDAEAAMPSSLLSTIESIDGTAFTLADTAHHSTTDAPVHFDNYYSYWNASVLSTPGSTVAPDTIWTYVPEGVYAQSKQISMVYNDGGGFVGAGKYHTIFLTPDGTPMEGVMINGENITAHSFGITGNEGHDGYHGRQEGFWGNGLIMAGEGRHQVYDIRVVDPVIRAFSIQDADNTQVFRTEAIMTEGRLNYGQWAYNCVTAVNCQYVDPKFSSPILQTGYEAFGSSNSAYTRPSGVNALFAFNTANRVEYLSLYNRLTVDAIHPLYLDIYENPVVNINANTGSGTAVSGFTVDNAVIVFDGPFTETGDLLRSISAGPPNMNEVSITGGLVWVDSTYWGVPLRWATGVTLRGNPLSNHVVDGLRVMVSAAGGGGPSTYAVDIFDPDALATVQNIVADEIRLSEATTASNNITVDDWLAAEGENIPPVADFVVMPLRGEGEYNFFPYELADWNDPESAYTEVAFDDDGFITKYLWEIRDAGDNILFSDKSRWTSYYFEPGTYSVRLTVMDDRHATDSITKPLVVE